MNDSYSVTISIYGDDTNCKLWAMEYKIQTPFGIVTFYDESCNKRELEEWRELILEDNPLYVSFRHGLLNREKDIFVLHVSAEETAGRFEMKREYLVGPLTKAIDEAVERGFFKKESNINR